MKLKFQVVQCHVRLNMLLSQKYTLWCRNTYIPLPFFSCYHCRHPAVLRVDARVKCQGRWWCEVDSNHPASGCQPVSAISFIIHRLTQHYYSAAERSCSRAPLSRRYKCLRTDSGGSTLGSGGHRPPNLAQAPTFLDTVVLLLVELIGSIVNFA